MKKFPLIVGLTTVLIIIVGVVLISPKDSSGVKTQILPANLEYFWGNGCPHCKAVTDFMNSWVKKDKVKINRYEAWDSSANAFLLKARFEYCKITNPNEMGVPLLFTPEGKCLVGDQPIIDYLKSI